MATYFLRARHISRGKGARATRAAAYRAGERLRDERTSEVYDYSSRRDVAHKEVVLASDLAGRPDMAWTQDRATLWNAMEHAGTRCNSRTAREWLVFLPPELTPEQRTCLARTFASELAEKYRCAVDLTIHQPRPTADPRNYHAHLLTTTREVSPDGVGARTTLELGGRERHLRGLGPTRDEYLATRERWAQLINEALREAGLSARVDHRSYERQGINREPVPTIPEKVLYAERAQGHSAAGDEIRARHRERVEARQKGARELARVLEKQTADLKGRALEDFKRREAQPDRIRWSALTRDRRNELRRERYKARRAIERQDPAVEARRREAARQRYHEDRQQNPEADRERRRQWRRNNAEEVNRKQREYRSAHAEELNRKRREYRKIHANDPNRRVRESQRAAAQQSLSMPAAPTPEDSARKWREYRQSHGPGPNAEESALKWRALRDSQKLADSSHSQPTEAVIRDRKVESATRDTDEPDRKPHPTHGQDIEL
jgi:MobA/MobL family